MSLVADLAAYWCTEAAGLRRRGAPQQAEALESCAEELEAALHEHEQATLTLKEAATASGYAEESLRRMVRDGTLPAERNAGKHSHIKVRRRDLPKKLPTQPRRADGSTQRYTVDKDARDIAQRLGDFSA